MFLSRVAPLLTVIMHIHYGRKYVSPVFDNNFRITYNFIMRIFYKINEVSKQLYAIKKYKLNFNYTSLHGNYKNIKKEGQ